MDPRFQIVSLLPSATEIVAALGLTECLVGRSHVCDFPESIGHIPEVTSCRLTDPNSSRGIDLEIKSALFMALSVFEVDHRKISELNPDIILTQTQCKACAVTLQDLTPFLSKKNDSALQIIDLAPALLCDVWSDIMKVARALHAEERGRRLVAGISERLQELSRNVFGKPQPRVVFLEWISPIMTSGHWIPELIQVAGGRAVLGSPGQRSQWIDWDKLRLADPDILVVAPCGFRLDQTRAELKHLQSLAGWKELKAFRENRIILADGNAFFNRPGPRLIESAEILAEVFHPESIDYGHAHSGHWMPWPCMD